jgi:hypothetical protein
MAYGVLERRESVVCSCPEALNDHVAREMGFPYSGWMKDEGSSEKRGWPAGCRIARCAPGPVRASIPMSSRLYALAKTIETWAIKS